MSQSATGYAFPGKQQVLKADNIGATERVRLVPRLLRYASLSFITKGTSKPYASKLWCLSSSQRQRKRIITKNTYRCPCWSSRAASNC